MLKTVKPKDGLVVVDLDNKPITGERDVNVQLSYYHRRIKAGDLIVVEPVKEKKKGK